MKCDDGWIGVESFRNYHFYDTPNFNIKSAQTGTLAVRLCIKIEGNALIILHIKMYIAIYLCNKCVNTSKFICAQVVHHHLGHQLEGQIIPYHNPYTSRLYSLITMNGKFLSDLNL